MTRKHSPFGRPRSERSDPGLALVLAKAGGITAVARQLGVTAQAVALWQRVPPRYVETLATCYRISRHKLRADLYDGRGRLRDPLARSTARAATPSP